MPPSYKQREMHRYLPPYRAKRDEKLYHTRMMEVPVLCVSLCLYDGVYASLIAQEKRGFEDNPIITQAERNRRVLTSIIQQKRGLVDTSIEKARGDA